jgi:uncharacterized membrane protein YdbT with pleckstrin-like domain
MRDPYLNSLLGERETILLITRQHWFLLFRSILFEILLITATVAAVTLVWIFWVPVPVSILGYLLVLIPLASLVRDTMIWLNHKYVVTSLRVIQIFGVFNKNVTDSSLEKVNDVKMDQSLFGRIFNFGDIEILTASELGINRFTSIGDPIRFKTAMLNAKYRLEQGRPDQPRSEAQSVIDVPRLIDQLDELRKRGALTETEFQEKKARLLARI